MIYRVSLNWTLWNWIGYVWSHPLEWNLSPLTSDLCLKNCLYTFPFPQTDSIFCLLSYASYVSHRYLTSLCPLIDQVSRINYEAWNHYVAMALIRRVEAFNLCFKSESGHRVSTWVVGGDMQLCWSVRLASYLIHDLRRLDRRINISFLLC